MSRKEEEESDMMDLTTKDDGAFVIAKMPVNIYQEILKRQILDQDRASDEHYVKGTWTDDEDSKLLGIVKKHGPKRWKFISTLIPGRNGKQCRERYLNHLDPKINKEPWSTDEDNTIFEMQMTSRNQWSKISKSLIGRTANAVKNRWNSTLKKKENDFLKRKTASPSTRGLKKIKVESIEEEDDSNLENAESQPREPFTAFGVYEEERDEIEEDEKDDFGVHPSTDPSTCGITLEEHQLDPKPNTIDGFFEFHVRQHANAGSFNTHP